MAAPMSPKQFLMFMRRGFAPFEQKVVKIVHMALVEGKTAEDKMAHITFALPEAPSRQHVEHCYVKQFGSTPGEQAAIFKRTANRVRTLIMRRGGRDDTIKNWMDGKPIRGIEFGRE